MMCCCRAPESRYDVRPQKGQLRSGASSSCRRLLVVVAEPLLLDAAAAADEVAEGAAMRRAAAAAAACFGCCCGLEACATAGQAWSSTRRWVRQTFCLHCGHLKVLLGPREVKQPGARHLATGAVKDAAGFWEHASA